jgi:hypothetical protein
VLGKFHLTLNRGIFCFFAFSFLRRSYFLFHSWALEGQTLIKSIDCQRSQRKTQSPQSFDFSVLEYLVVK